MTVNYKSPDNLPAGDPSASPVMPGAIPLWARPLNLLAFAFIAVLLVFWQTTTAVYSFWLDMDTYSHGPLLLPISAYLIWRDRTRLAISLPRPVLPGLALLALICLGWWLSFLVDVRLVQQIALFALIIAVIWVILGGQILRHLAFPLGYLWLGVPIWSPLEGLLQGITVAVVAQALPLAGVPILVEGDFISIPSGRFHVEEACAGLRFVLAAVAISSLYAYLGGFGWKRGAKFVSIAIGMAMVANWVRVFVVVFIGHVSEMQHPWVNDHLALGWWMFAVTLVPLFWIGYRMAPSMGSEEHNMVLPTVKADFGRIVTVLVATCTILLLAAASANWIKHGMGESQVTLNVPMSPGWELGQVPAVWQPIFNGADQELRLNFQDGGRQGAAYLAYYARQDQGKELVNDLNAVYDKKHWELVSKQIRHIEHPGMPNASVLELVVRTPGGRTWLVWYWYHVADRSTVNPRTAKLLQLWDLLSSRQGGAVVAVAAHFKDSPQDARVLLSDMVDKLGIDFSHGPSQFIRK